MVEYVSKQSTLYQEPLSYVTVIHQLSVIIGRTRKLGAETQVHVIYIILIFCLIAHKISVLGIILQSVVNKDMGNKCKII